MFSLQSQIKVTRPVGNKPMSIIYIYIYIGWLDVKYKRINSLNMNKCHYNNVALLIRFFSKKKNKKK